MGSTMRNQEEHVLRGCLEAGFRALLTVCLAVLGFSALAVTGYAQENPLDNVVTPAPPPKPKTPEEQKPVIEGSSNVAAGATSHRSYEPPGYRP